MAPVIEALAPAMLADKWNILPIATALKVGIPEVQSAIQYTPGSKVQVRPETAFVPVVPVSILELK